MVIADKIVTLICLFGGFFWLRARARSINLENRIGKVIAGVFILLPIILFGEKYLFDHFHFGPYTDLLLKVGLLAATFPVIGFAFLKPQAADADPAAGGTVERAAAAPEAESRRDA